jgi:hypothetical protein
MIPQAAEAEHSRSGLLRDQARAWRAAEPYPIIEHDPRASLLFTRVELTQSPPQPVQPSAGATFTNLLVPRTRTRRDISGGNARLQDCGATTVFTRETAGSCDLDARAQHPRNELASLAMIGRSPVLGLVLDLEQGGLPADRRSPCGTSVQPTAHKPETVGRDSYSPQPADWRARPRQMAGWSR